MNLRLPTKHYLEFLSLEGGCTGSSESTLVKMTHCWKPGVQWLNGTCRLLDSRPRGRGLKPHRRHCVVSFSKNINPSLVLVQPRKTRHFITERLLMGPKDSNQTKRCWKSHVAATCNTGYTHIPMRGSFIR